MYQYMKTSRISKQMSFLDLSYVPLDIHASLSVTPGSEEATRMTATSGQRLLELSRSAGPIGCLEKMLLDTSVWGSTRCFLTWREKATPAGRSILELWPSMPPTEECGSSLWATPTANLSIACTMKAAAKEAKRLHPRNQYTLATQVSQTQEGLSMPHASFNPEWVEWLMGFPPGWTDCEDSGMQ